MAGSASLLDVALVQADLRWQDAEGNRRHLGRLMDRHPGCDLYVLPETFTTGFLGDAGLAAETMEGESLGWMRDQARLRNAAVCGSLVIEDASGQRRNRMIFMPPEGKPWYYDKRHRFGYGGEDERYAAGEEPVVVEWQGWRIDLQICYDLRFPVWCRNGRDFDLQIFVANWPAPRADHWDTLLKARAIENQSYVIGVNRCGRDGNGLAYKGGSVVWTAEGSKLCDLGCEEKIARAQLSLDALAETRNQLPFLADADHYQLD